MDDLISRRAAIDAIESHIRTAEEPYQLSQTEKVLNHAFEIAASCVYNLPSAQTEHNTQLYTDGFVDGYAQCKKDKAQWIPCSEKLPEEYGEYRVTWTTSASKNRLIGDAEYEVTGEWDEVNGRFKGEWLLDEYIKDYPNVEVLAWKLLEEPWKGEQP